MTPFDSPRLIADIGTTFARFALEVGKDQFEHITSLRCAEFANFQSAVTHYLELVKPVQILHAAVAVANPVVGDVVIMTNYHWQFSIEQMRVHLGFETLVIINDYTALAMAVPRLEAQHVRKVGGGLLVDPAEKKVIGILGTGSGLGMSGLIPSADSWIALGSEGGHSSFAPYDEREIVVLRYAWKSFKHVSFERLLSGRGMELMYRALADHANVPGLNLSAPEITQRAMHGSDKVCAETLEVFCGLLGTAAANLALTLGATGGIYIEGTIVPRLGSYFDRSPFRARFEDKGRFSQYLAAIPTYVIVADHTSFIGISEILDSQLRSIEATPGAAILGQIRRSRNDLSPAELRVADYILEHPRTALNDPITAIAKAAQVSQPTVIRFCRSLGCEGLSDFKLRLASGLTGTIPLTHTEVTNQDSMVELSAKVLGNTASAILQVRNQINRDMVNRCIDLLMHANRVDFFAIGHFGVVAHDAQFKFLRLGIASSAYTDLRLQPLAADVLKPNDVIVIISNSGRVPELLEVAEKARARGAAVIAITSSQSPLVKAADVALIVDHVEDRLTALPMISRILYLLVIDIIAVGVAMKRSANGEQYPDAQDPLLALKKSDEPAYGTPQGVSLASPLSGLTSPGR